MDKCLLQLPVLLLTLTFLTVTQGQYYDIIQGLQQFFQPYQQQNDYLTQFNNVNRHTGTHRQEHKKKTEIHTKSPPIHQYDYVFSTTSAPKPSRKPSKSSSSQTNKNSNRNFNTGLIFSDYFTPTYEFTTKRNRVTTDRKPATVTPINKATTQNPFGSININNRGPNRPVTENAFENNNHRDVYAVNNFENHSNLNTNNENTRRPDSFSNTEYNNNYDKVVPTNTRNPNVQNININNRPSNNAGFTNDFNTFARPTNNRNPDVYAINNPNRGNQNNRNNNFGSTTSSFTNNDFNNFARPTNSRNPDVYAINNPNRGNQNFGSTTSSLINNDFNNFARPTNNRNPDVYAINNQNRGNQNNRNPNFGSTTSSFTNNNFNNFARPTNSRNPDVYAINNQNRGNQNNRNPNFGSSTSSFINNDSNNRGNNNFGNNRGPPNNFNSNRGNLNTDYDFNNNGAESNYPGTPLINRPGVRPAPVDVNQPPITNKPLTDRNNFLPFERPSNDGNGYTESPVDSPEILIGPDEDDMSEGEKRRYISMAERMCDRYKSLSIKEVVALPLLPSPDPVEFNVSSCVPITIPLVIGGKIASINEFPHMALVGWRKIRAGGYSWKCGGSLISNRYILTAGHCTYQDKDYDAESGPPQAVQLGSSYLDDPGALVVKISAVIRHPKYKQRRAYFDIALIKMAQTVTFSEVIRPACLGVPPPVGQNIIATGWGRTEFGGDHSMELRTVSLPVWNMAECREVWGTSLKLPNGPNPDSHVCAGEKRGGKDTCQGDSGGPAQIQDGCVWRVVAVTSFGRSCGAPNTPALYAVTKRAFIAAQVFGEETPQGFENRNQSPQRFDDRRPTFNDRQQSFVNTRQPNFVVHNFRRQ